MLAYLRLSLMPKGENGKLRSISREVVIHPSTTIRRATYKVDDIVWSSRRLEELGRNDLASRNAVTKRSYDTVYTSSSTGA